MIVHITPTAGSMALLSQIEAKILERSAVGSLYTLFRNCCLAVLNSGVVTDNTEELLDRYSTFEINLLRIERGIKLELVNPPTSAFVDGRIIRSIQKNLFSVLRDLLYVHEYQHVQTGTIYDIINLSADTKNHFYISNLVFYILRNARILRAVGDPNMVVCWGGHAINEVEYDYTHKVGVELGLRLLNICTGCGPGAMEGPMKGAAVGHAQQTYKKSLFVGITEPSIIAAEPPNQLVNELVIMPDIEKRLETFVRFGHGIVIFPGGPGTAEEFLYILSILMDPKNHNHCLPVILTGPKESYDYFAVLDEFILHTLGERAQDFYTIIIDDPVAVAQTMSRSMPKIKANRRTHGDSYSFNWSLFLSEDLQQPFNPTHENMAKLALTYSQPVEKLAASLRKAFSGIVAGNVKEAGIQAIKQLGPYKISGDPKIMAHIDRLLTQFVEQRRMSINHESYRPCYEIVYNTEIT